MSFWAGFACGVAAVYGLSLLAFVLLFRPRRQPCQQARMRQVVEERACPEYPTVRFTHVTGIGEYVRGSDG
jgi:hypothetical protein